MLLKGLIRTYRKAGLLTALLLVFLSASSLSVFVFPQTETDTVIAPLLTKPVTLDGKWTALDEWSDASEILGDQPSSYFRLKHDDKFLYVLADYIADTTINSIDVAWVYIDSLKNRGAKPQPDDYAFGIIWRSTSRPEMWMQAGTGSTWADVNPPLHQAASSTDASNNPMSSVPHLMYETKIPMSILQNPSVGLRLSIHNGKSDTWTGWPASVGRDNPSLWGTMEISSAPIPEFSSTVMILMLGLGLPLYILKRRKRNKLRPNKTP